MLMRGPQDGAGWRVTLPALLEQVVLVAVLSIAALISYTHLRDVWIAAGAPWPNLGPLLADGLFAAAWLRMRRRRLAGEPVGWLAWLALGLALAATLGGNLAAAWIGGHRDVLSMVVAGWPALAFALVWELVTGHGRTGHRGDVTPVRATLTIPGAATLPAGATTPPQDAASVGLVGAPPPWRPRLVADLVAQHHPATTPPAPPPTKPSPTVATAPTTTPKTESLPAVVFDANAPQEERLAAIFAAGRGRGTVSEAFGLDPNPARKVWDEYRARRRQEASA